MSQKAFRNVSWTMFFKMKKNAKTRERKQAVACIATTCHVCIRRISENYNRSQFALKGFSPSTATILLPSLRSETGISAESIFFPSTSMLATPLQMCEGFFTSIERFIPRQRRSTLKPSHFLGMHGSIKSPSYCGRIPKMYCVME